MPKGTFVDGRDLRQRNCLIYTVMGNFARGHLVLDLVHKLLTHCITRQHLGKDGYMLALKPY